MRRFSLDKTVLNSIFIDVNFLTENTLETFHHQIVGTYSILISHSSQLSSNFCMLIVTCSQSSPSQTHLAEHVFRTSFPVVAGPLNVQLRYIPERSHPDDLVIPSATSTWDVEQTRRRPVILTVKDALIASGTRLLMLRPGNQHFPCGCGFQRPTEYTYIAELSRVTQVSLMASTSLADFTNDIGGSSSRPFVNSSSFLSYVSATTSFNSLFDTRIHVNITYTTIMLHLSVHIFKWKSKHYNYNIKANGKN